MMIVILATIVHDYLDDWVQKKVDKREDAWVFGNEVCKK